MPRRTKHLGPPAKGLRKITRYRDKKSGQFIGKTEAFRRRAISRALKEHWQRELTRRARISRTLRARIAKEIRRRERPAPVRRPPKKAPPVRPPKKPPKVIKEKYEYRVTEFGQWETGIRVPTVETITKKISQLQLNKWDGYIKNALYASNITSKFQRGSIFDFGLKGWDQKKRKWVSFKKSLDIRAIRRKGKITDVMMFWVMDLLHGHGYRVEYPLKIVAWTGKETRKYEAAEMMVLQDVTIMARVRN